MSSDNPQKPVVNVDELELMEFAHQIINTGSETMKYLGLSTKTQPEVVEYPDSGKFLVASRMEDSSPMSAKFRFIGREDTSLDYWDGEKD